MRKNAKQTGSRGRVAILLTDGFEQVEMTGPREALEKGGYEALLVSPKPSTVTGMIHDRKGKAFKVDVPLSRARPQEFDALLLPGGVMNPDSLRMEPKAVEFVSSFFKAHKPVAAICHGPIMLIEAGVLKGRTITSFPSIRTDVENAGARWVNKTMASDDNLVTSRKPDDIPVFNKAMLRVFGGGNGSR